ncbi:MAG TPA: sulfotransferase family 2 domain-containing protein [Caulobacteraceae bacterium]
MAIVSHELGFIFCKTRKTAGTSLEVYLARRCGPADVVTPIHPPNPEHQPRNHRGKKLYGHMPMAELKEILGDSFQRYFKFCVERHPVDKCISHYAMLTQSPAHRNLSKPSSWDEYVNRRKFPMDFNKYTTEDGRLLVDKIYRYEDLDSMLAELSSRFGWPNESLDVYEKAGFRDLAPTVEDVTDRQREIIFEAFQPSLQVAPY